MVTRINLALQGGGAHGAFTWGVLDRILDDEEIEVAGISGTSAGALNGAAYKAGWMRGGREGARRTLNDLWYRMGAVNDMRLPAWMASPVSAMEKFFPTTSDLATAVEFSPPVLAADALKSVTSPYAYGAFYRNPLEPVVEAFDFGDVCAGAGPRLFVCATNVRTGKVRIFTRDEITTDAILASACLPSLFQAIKIEDPRTGRVDAYWDGGYSGNPALFPLFDKELPNDVVIVNINPLERDEIPITPQQIDNRVNEISFNSSLLRELRAIAFVQRLLEAHQLPEGTMKNVLVHMIADDDLMRDLSVATKMVPNPILLNQLKMAGRRAAERFLKDHRSNLGHRSTVDLPAMLN
ncbi:phospholipase, patatin-like family protein [Pseudooceanicola batsensis HTCC2597]|uniref:Phospholipase, patatin-like family protein n=1 Tax=Pseudooceanicola batsensis (strain ATCC BAA-863 / DSM 15984 / KCTC 12145 / HTCC2597) TaxID=252305 RepID=A3TXR4_PSEBH|nr:patatin-like phospholipase family protein [Pseudooceanicola batsensis]EAQ03624.1 phospholipase, patatin-like family protein [Pseudooceanicola batsensis HTCC2597]